MSTRKQRSANRRAQEKQSQGPVPAGDQTKSRFNPLKHGIHPETQVMFDEAPEDLAELAAEMHAQYAPADPTERFLVDTLIHNEWRLRRMRRIDPAVWQQAVQSLQNGGSGIDRLQRIVNSCERNFHRALKELQRLQAARPSIPEHSQDKETKASSKSAGSFRKQPNLLFQTRQPPCPPGRLQAFPQVCRRQFHPSQPQPHKTSPLFITAQDRFPKPLR